MVEKAMVWCGSKCTGATWERSRKVPPRFGVWARADPGVETAAVAPTARAVPPSLRRSRRVREEVGWSMIALLEAGYRSSQAAVTRPPQSYPRFGPWFLKGTARTPAEPALSFSRSRRLSGTRVGSGVIRFPPVVVDVQTDSGGPSVATIWRQTRPMSRFLRLPLEPGGHQAPAVVVAHVGSVILDRGVPHRDLDRGRHLHVVLLLGQVALDLPDDLAALHRIRGAPLADQHVGHDRIVDVPVVLDLARVVLAVEEVVGLLEAGLGAEGHRVVLAVERGRDVRAVLLGDELGVDADVLQVLEHELENTGED